MKLFELCEYAKIYCPRHLCELEITGVTCDSRRVKPGDLFVCIKGLHSDGNDHAQEAIAAGALAVLSDRRRDLDLFCDDAKGAFAHLCRAMYGGGIEKLKLIGVTGTNGKTSVTAMLRSIFDAAGFKTASIGTLGCFSPKGKLDGEISGSMTTPDTEMLYGLLSRLAKDGAEYVFMEISSHSLAEKKVDALHFDVGIFTNFSRDHLDFHENEENYFEAKKRLFALSDKMIVNADDPRLDALENTLSCSARKAARYMAKDVTYYGADGCGYVFLSEHCRFAIVSRIAGRFTVMNTLLAAACATEMGIEPDFIKQGIHGLSCVEGRMERVLLDGADFSVYIDYAHTPDALENILLTVKGFTEGKIILVFGCGGDRDRGKRPEMARIASRLADKIIITSDNSRGEDPEQIFSDILVGISKNADCELIRDRKEAIEKAMLLAGRGDALLLAGKGHEKYEIDADGKHPFDEAAVARAAFEKR